MLRGVEELADAVKVTMGPKVKLSIFLLFFLFSFCLVFFFFFCQKYVSSGNELF